MKKVFTIFALLFLSTFAVAQTFNNTTGGPIPDGFGALTPDPGPRVCFPIAVTGVGPLTAANGLKTVCINITHTYDADLIIFLKAPSGEYIPLSGIPGDNGDGNGGSGDNYTNTCFTMTAATPISLGTAPFTGNFLPEYPLGWFNDNNINANGTWSLCVEDNYQDDIGTVNNWSITFGPTAPPYPVSSCNGNLAANNFCQNATPICNLNGYCGNTTDIYSAYVWDELELAFCGSIENNSFIKFVPSAATASFNVNVTNSAFGDGIQMMVFSGGCGSGAVTTYGCQNQMLPGANVFTATGLTPGNTYYLMIDGYAGDVCDYTITATAGVNILTVTPSAPRICAGDPTGVTLTASGGNGTYTWSPAAGLSATTGATVTANPGSTQTYTVTSGAVGSLNCPLTKTVTVTVSPPPVVSAPASVCVGSTITLSPTSGGTWVSSNFTIASVTNGGVVTGVSLGAATFTFTNTITGCSNTTTTVIVTAATATPLFNPVAPICSGATAPVLPTTSTNGITGTWNPVVVSNTASGTYTFTPNAGQCATTATLTVTVTPNTVPTFNPVAPICNGASAPVLPATSTNGISGTWNPAVVSNTASGTYTFTPNGGQCATTATLAVTVNPNISPVISCGNTTATSVTFNWLAVAGATGYTISYTINGGAPISGGSIVANTYPVTGLTVNDVVVITVTPTGTGCFAAGTGSCTAVACVAATAVLTSAAGTNNQTQCINTPITNIVYSIGGSATGASVAGLPAGITGVYNAGVFTISGTTPAAPGNFNYTVTTSGGCSVATATGSITVTAPVVPVFGVFAPICTGAPAPILSTTSINGISGTWNPAIVSNTVTATYTFTPTAGQCATTTTLTVSVQPNTIVPAFNPVAPICSGAVAPVLPTTSTNAITGTWNPATVSNTVTGTYTFTPASGQCALTTTLTVTVNTPATPAFTPIQTLCVGSVPPVLPLVSSNGIAGTWAPAIINTASPATTTHTFTPAAGQCAIATTMSVTVNPLVVPVFTPILPFCAGSTAPVLPNTSTNGITGTWSPATISNTNSGIYTFTPAAAASCALPVTLPVVVLPLPNVNLGNDTTICESASYVLNATIASPLATYLWQDGSTNPTYTVTQAGTYSVLVNNGICSKTDNIIISYNLKPRFSLGLNSVICPTQTILLSTGLTDPALTHLWQDGSTGRTFTVTQPGTYYVDVSNTCGTTRETVFVGTGICKIWMPGAFSPNRDGLNDRYKPGGGEAVTKFSMLIFNRYGEKVFESDNTAKGWDGTYKLSRQPVGTYIYIVTYTDPVTGVISNLKGSFLLIR
jgi:gliding motility-associated-like protein